MVWGFAFFSTKFSKVSNYLHVSDPTLLHWKTLTLENCLLFSAFKLCSCHIYPSDHLKKWLPVGAHTIGFAHCNRFFSRIYNFKSSNRIDPTLDPAYGKYLREVCPKNVDPRLVIDMDPNTPQKFDNMYYQNLQRGMGLFTSDQSLFTEKRSRKIVNLFASNNTAFEQAFVAAITKLGRLGVRTGNQGEIRHNCAMVN